MAGNAPLNEWQSDGSADFLHIKGPGGSLLGSINSDGTSTFGVSSPSFSSISAGINTAALVIGSGGSLSATGTGTNVATSINGPEIAAPLGIASSILFFGDSVTHTPSFNENNNGTSSFSGAWSNTNVSPVTVSANTASDQNLMAAVVPAGTLNRVGRTLRVWISGVYSTPVTSTSVIVVKIKLGGGGAATLASWTSTALASVQATNNQFNVCAYATVQTAGTAPFFETHGNLAIDLGAGNAVADSIFADRNTTTLANNNTLLDQTLQVTISFSNANASNSATQRQMILETIG